MSSVVNFNPPGSNPYLRDPEFYRLFQNQFCHPSQTSMHQQTQNLYQVKQKIFNNQPQQWQQGRHIQGSSNMTFQSQNHRFVSPQVSPDQVFYPGHHANARSTPVSQYQQQQFSIGYQGSNNHFNNGQMNISPDQSLMSPSLHDCSGFTVSSPEQSPNFLQYQWDGFNAHSQAQNDLQIPEVQGVTSSVVQGSSTMVGQVQPRYIISDVKYMEEDDESGTSNQLVIQLDEKLPDQSSILVQGSTSEIWNNQDQKDVVFDLNQDNIPASLPDFKESDLSFIIPAPDPLTHVTLPTLVDTCTNKSPGSDQASNTAVETFAEEDLDEDLERGTAYPAGSAEQTRLLASSQFMKNFRRQIDDLKAKHGPYIAFNIVKEDKYTTTPTSRGGRKMVQPQRRQLKKDANLETFPDPFFLDLNKVNGRKTFDFGGPQWTLSFDENPNFKKFFYEGMFNLNSFK